MITTYYVYTGGAGVVRCPICKNIVQNEDLLEHVNFEIEQLRKRLLNIL